MKIRKAKLSEAIKALRLAKEADERFEPYDIKWMKHNLKNKGRVFLVAEDKGKFVGYVGLAKKDSDERVKKKLDIDKKAVVMWIGVLKEYRNKKVGSKLLKACEQQAKKWKKEGIWLDCRKEVLPFYKSNGYKVVAHFTKIIRNKPRRKYVLLKSLK